MDKLTIATANSRMTKVWKNTRLTWEELLKRLETTTRTAETQGEYRNMTKKQQDDRKDVGGFVGGELREGKRKAGYINKRYLLTLDADFAESDFLDRLSLFISCAWAVYSTHKHAPDNPRYRLLIPLSRPVDADEYEAIGRKIAEELGIEQFDDTTYQAHRLMYWPSTSMDGQYVFEHADGAPLDVDRYLAKYTDWHDVSTWPRSSRTQAKQARSLKKQEDPTTKRGIIGAFCRAYTIDEAIEKFLPDVYTKCAMPDRYTYAYGSTAAGLAVYEDGKFAYSNHATDPCSGILCNAFDLVRLHKFGELDSEAADGTPTVKLPSYLAMQELAADDETVKRLLYKERLAAAQQDFGEMTAEGEETEEDSGEWAASLAVDGKGRYAATIDNVKKILSHDAALKKKIRLNEFTRKYRVFGKVPWDDETKPRDWTDADDAGLRHYLEKVYGIHGKSIIEDAWTLTAAANKYHPVRDYLNTLSWDGVHRVETLFVDYMGADDGLYTRTVTRKALIAAVARVFEPGIKFDTMLTLVGPQGCGKSQIIKRLGREWYSDSLDSMKGKEAYEQLQGFWIIEVGELAAMKRLEIEATKMFITKSEDTYRAAYGRHTETNKRQCVFFGTTNTHEFLKDTTGNRRFWPVDVHPEKARKNLWEELTEDVIGQIWAEALWLYRQGEALYLEEERLRRLAEEAQTGHRETNPLEGLILAYLDKPLPEGWDDYDLPARRMYYQGGDFGEQPEGTVIRQKVCSLEIWCELLGGEKRELTIGKSKEIRDIIQNAGGWEAVKSSMRFGRLYGTQRGFIRKDCINP